MVSAFYRAKNVIKVFCKGKGIPVVEHDKEKMYVPSLVFCHSLTSFNYNDQEETVTGGCNCFGSIFSRSFELKTGSKVECKSFKLSNWKPNVLVEADALTPKLSKLFKFIFSDGSQKEKLLIRI